MFFIFNFTGYFSRMCPGAPSPGVAVPLAAQAHECASRRLAHGPPPLSHELHLIVLSLAGDPVVCFCGTGIIRIHLVDTPAPGYFPIFSVSFKLPRSFLLDYVFLFVPRPIFLSSLFPHVGRCYLSVFQSNSHPRRQKLDPESGGGGPPFLQPP